MRTEVRACLLLGAARASRCVNRRAVAAETTHRPLSDREQALRGMTLLPKGWEESTDLATGQIVYRHAGANLTTGTRPVLPRAYEPNGVYHVTMERHVSSRDIAEM